jgi:hypothetical protein
MNERIRELAKQAEIKFEATLEHSGIDTAVIIPADLEKFAEEIVQKCLLAISKTPNLVTDEEVAVMVKCHDQIEKYFGVQPWTVFKS